MNRKADLCIMFASFIILAEGNTVTLLPDGYADVVSGMPLSLQCVYSGTNNPFTFNFYFNQSTNGLQIRVSNCLIFSAVGYNTSLYNRSCGTNNVSLIILAVPQEHDGQKWECDVSFTTVVPIPPKASTILRVTAATTPATTPTTTVTTVTTTATTTTLSVTTVTTTTNTTTISASSTETGTIQNVTVTSPCTSPVMPPIIVIIGIIVGGILLIVLIFIICCCCQCCYLCHCRNEAESEETNHNQDDYKYTTAEDVTQSVLSDAPSESSKFDQSKQVHPNINMTQF